MFHRCKLPVGMACIFLWRWRIDKAFGRVGHGGAPSCRGVVGERYALHFDSERLSCVQSLLCQRHSPERRGKGERGAESLTHAHRSHQSTRRRGRVIRFQLRSGRPLFRSPNVHSRPNRDCRSHALTKHACLQPFRAGTRTASHAVAPNWQADDIDC